MVFTCNACETRAVKCFSRQAYERGIVILTCPGCSSRHLIADNLGWFGDNTNIEAVLQEKGQAVQRLKESDALDLDSFAGLQVCNSFACGVLLVFVCSKGLSACPSSAYAYAQAETENCWHLRWHCAHM